LRYTHRGCRCAVRTSRRGYLDLSPIVPIVPIDPRSRSMDSLQKKAVASSGKSITSTERPLAQLDRALWLRTNGPKPYSLFSSVVLRDKASPPCSYRPSELTENVPKASPELRVSEDSTMRASSGARQQIDRHRKKESGIAVTLYLGPMSCSAGFMYCVRKCLLHTCPNSSGFMRTEASQRSSR